MAVFPYANLISDVEALANLTGQRAMVQRLINEAVGVIASEWDWPELWDDDFFPTVAEYTTGTITVTSGSTTVTGSGTTFTSAMVGRKLRVSGQRAYYVISAFVSTTELTLEAAYQGDTESGASYSIYQDEFRLRGDVDQAKLIRQVENGTALFSTHVTDLDQASPTAMGRATVSVVIGRRQDTYTTGTVAMTSGSRTITGTSTAWTTPQGISRGCKIQIGSVVFTIRSVDSATQLTVYEAATATISAGTTYTIQLSNIVVQLTPAPDTQENYYYRFQRHPAILNADQDLPDLPPACFPLIKPYVMAYLWEHKGFMDRKASAETTYENRLAKLKVSRGFANPDQVLRRKDVDRGSPTFRSGVILR